MKFLSLVVAAALSLSSVEARQARIIPTGAVGGDPHFRTHDGTVYSFHGECDLVMASSQSFDNGVGVDVHARTSIVAGWSLVSSAAVRIGNDIFEVSNDGTHYFNGVAGLAFPFHMNGKYAVNLVENADDKGRSWYVIELNDGEQVKIVNLKKMLGVSVQVEGSDMVGMLGTAGKTGIIARNGETVLQDGNAMGFEWQVTDKEAMLFHDIRAPQYPTKCIMPDMTARRQLRHSEEAMQRAKEACADVSAELRSFCEEDILLTGDVDAAHAFGGLVF